MDPTPPGAGHAPYYTVSSHGHWMSKYPIITPVVVTPLYVLPAWWLSRQSPPLYPYSRPFVLIADTMEKLSASLIAAMSGAFLFLAFRKVASRNVSLVVALIYGLASNTWTISSQALWRHGLTELSFTFLLWALFRVPDSHSAPFWAGLALALATANKPLEAILIVAFLLYFVARRQWKNGLLFLTPLVALGSLALAYNLHNFAKLVGGYGIGSLGAVAHFPFWAHLGIGLPGSLASPSRGLLVYTPWVAFAFWGAARLWKEKSPGWSRPLIVALAAIWVVQVGWDHMVGRVVLRSPLLHGPVALLRLVPGAGVGQHSGSPCAAGGVRCDRGHRLVGASGGRLLLPGRELGRLARQR